MSGIQWDDDGNGTLLLPGDHPMSSQANVERLAGKVNGDQLGSNLPGTVLLCRAIKQNFAGDWVLLFKYNSSGWNNVMDQDGIPRMVVDVRTNNPLYGIADMGSLLRSKDQ